MSSPKSNSGLNVQAKLAEKERKLREKQERNAKKLEAAAKKLEDDKKKLEKTANAAIKKAAKEKVDREKAEHRLAVYAAANAAGIPHDVVRYVGTKSVKNIINSAQKKLNTLKRKNEKAVKGPSASNVLKGLKQQAYAQGFVDANLGRITSKMTINEVIAQATKRKDKGRVTQNKNAHKKLILNSLAEHGFTAENAGRITSKMTINEIIAQAAKRRGRLTAKQEKDAKKQAVIQAAKNAGLSEQNLRFRGKKSIHELIANAQKRRNRETYKQTKVQQKEAVMASTGLNEATIKSLFCYRSK